jgi:hypothetical protein
MFKEACDAFSLDLAKAIEKARLSNVVDPPSRSAGLDRSGVYLGVGSGPLHRLRLAA